jgi:hypothetical protein
LGQSKHDDAHNSKEKPPRGVAALRPGVVSVEPSTSEEPRGDAVISSHSSRLGQSKHGDALNSKEKPSRGVAALCPGAVSGGTNTLEEPGSIDVSTHSSRL